MEETKEVGDTALDQKIIRQVEYYFGDFNLPRDKFLQEQIKLDDGWIPLSTMLNFKRLASLTTDQDVIIDALKKSSVKLIEVDEEKKKIRRSLEKPVPEMTEGRLKEVQARTVYCKGFTKENATLDKLLAFFGQFGSVDNVQMRSYLDKATNEYIFKGSVFVVFSTKEAAGEFMKKESVEYEGVKLIVKKQEDYFADKRKEREEKRKMQKAKVQQATNKQPQSAGQKSQDVEDKESDEEEEEKATGFPKGALVHMEDVPKNATREDIKSAVALLWKKGAKEGEDTDITVAYVDFNMGDSEGWIRLAEADTALTLLQRAKAVAESSKKTKAKDTVKAKAGDSGGGDGKADEINGVEKDKDTSKEGDAIMEEADEKVTEEGDEASSGDGDKDKDGVEQDSSVSHLEVCDALVSIRALQGSEEAEYLEKARGAREKKLSSSRNRSRGGHGHGNRRGRLMTHQVKKRTLKC